MLTGADSMEIAAWLQSLGLERYEPAFRANDVDMEVLLRLTAEDLRDLGVDSVGHRRKLLSSIAAFSHGSSSAGKPAALSFKNGVAKHPVLAVTEAERRQLTVVFCDMVGSTDLSTRLDPEDLREIVYAYQECCAEIIDDLGGYV